MTTTENEVSGEIFENREFCGSELSQKFFEDCVFKRCRFQDCRMAGTRFLDCRFEACDLSLANLMGASFRGAQFLECKAVGVNFTSTAGFHGPKFHNCKLTDTVWAKLDLRGSTFVDCSLENADFEYARLDKVLFKNSLLGGARFVKTSLVETDFSTASDYAIDPRHNTIKKTKVALPEALAVLEILGFQVQ